MVLVWESARCSIATADSDQRNSQLQGADLLCEWSPNAEHLSFANMKVSSSGFTLIELLVVIVIMSVLAAIALPSYLSIRNRASSREAMLLLSSLMKEEQAHFVEHNEWSSTEDTSTTPELRNYEVVIDTFTNHQTQAGERVSGLRLRAIPQKESLVYVMGKVWVADNDVQTVLCNSERDTPFMQSRTYCPE